MNDRDFKLLVREYFKQKSLYDRLGNEPALAYMKILEADILKELKEFTKKDIAELPFS